MIERDPYISIEEAEAFTGLARRTCYDKISAGSWEVKPGEVAAENGKAPVQIRVASLPADVQVRYWQHALTPAAPTDNAPAVNLTEFPEGARDEAMRRLPIVLAAVEIMMDARDVNARIKALAAQHQEGRSTIYRWVTAYREEGLTGLLPGWGKLRGRFTAISDALAGVIRDEYLKPERPSVTDVHRRVAAFCAQVSVACPSAATIARFLTTIPKSVVLQKRYGTQAYRAHGEPKIHRDYNDLAVGEMWVGDHRELDLFVRAADDPNAKCFRPWLTAWMDLRSRTLVGWHLDLVPNSHTIALALRAGVLRYGLPQRLYVDNGKDYTANFWGGKRQTSKAVGLDANARTVLGLLQISITHAQVRAPWAKAIERWFGNLPAWERQLPGWCGRDNKERPEKLMIERKAGDFLTLDEIRGRLAAFIDDYHTRAHGGQGMEDATPQSCWAGIEKRIPDARALDLALMPHKPAKVFNDGLRLFGRHYWHDALVAHFGRTVEVRFDPANIGVLVVFQRPSPTSTPVFLCEAKWDLPYPMSEKGAREANRRRKVSVTFLDHYDEHHAIAFDQDKAMELIAANSDGRKIVPIRRSDPSPEPGGHVTRQLTGLERDASAQQRTAVASGPKTAAVNAPASREKSLRQELLED